MIDFVLPWVDGGDPIWQKSRVAFSPAGVRETDAGACRYRDWGLLKYWFRAVEQNAPWVRKIFFITCGQIPDFLNTAHPKLRLINHQDYIPSCWLPTFSSHCIELNLHRIPDLSEQFVYFNDDTFLNQPCSPEDFFRNELPCYRLMYRRILKPGPTDPAYEHARYNAAEAVSRHYSKKDTIRAGASRLFSPSYGLKTIVWNLLQYSQKELLDFMDPHVPVPFLKSTLSEVWEKEELLLAETSSHRFRDPSDVSQCIFRYWDLARGHFSPSRESARCFGILESTLPEIRHELFEKDHRLICLNDDENCAESEKIAQELHEILKTRYPDPSGFEK